MIARNYREEKGEVNEEGYDPREASTISLLLAKRFVVAMDTNQHFSDTMDTNLSRILMENIKFQRDN